MSNTALVTGASSGIGRAYAQLHASMGGDVVLVARREAELDALRQTLEAEHGIKATVVAVDLSEPDAAQRVFEATEAAGIQVDVLVNNAGFGGHGTFHEQDLARVNAMMQVNMVSLTNLTHCYLQGMVARGSGRILHVASTAGFMPGPLQAVYYATKAYVISFSQAIAEELRDTGVTSTVLCPGAVATEFQQAGDLDGLDLWDKAATPEAVARCGWDAMNNGELLKINESSLNFLLGWVIPLLPRKTVLGMSRKLMEKG